MDNIRTFTNTKRRAATYATALKTQRMVRNAADRFESQSQAPVQPYRTINGSRRCVELADLWAGITGGADTGGTCIAACVTATMPADHVGVCRRSFGTAAAFAFTMMAEQLTHVTDLTDTFAVRQALLAAWDAFEIRRMQANNISEGFGFDESAAWQTLRDIENTPDVRDRMLKIAQLAGRMLKAIGHMKRTMPNDDPQNVRGTTIGGDIERIHGSEMAMLDDADVGDMQSMKVLKKQAQQRKMQGIEAKTRGPLVICLDESASMHDRNSGVAGRNTWAKACALALTQIAHDENREVVVVHFSTGTSVQALVKGDTRSIWEMTRSFMSGGTSFTGAFEAAKLEVADLEARGFKGADVMIITDGQDPNADLQNAMIDQFDADGVKLWTVGVGLVIDANAPIRKRAERYVQARDRDLANADNAANLARGLGDAAKANMN